MVKKIIIRYWKYEIDSELRYKLMASYNSTDILAAVKAAQAVDGYVNVAEYEYDDRISLVNNLERTYNAMQNGVITDSWLLSPPDGLTPLVQPFISKGEKYGWRSASMGDLFIIDDKTYVCSAVGFEEVPG